MFTSVRVVRLSSLNLTNQALNKNFNGLCENLLKVGACHSEPRLTGPVSFVPSASHACQSQLCHRETLLRVGTVEEAI